MAGQMSSIVMPSTIMTSASCRNSSSACPAFLTSGSWPTIFSASARHATRRSISAALSALFSGVCPRDTVPDCVPGQPVSRPRAFPSEAFPRYRRMRSAAVMAPFLKIVGLPAKGTSFRYSTALRNVDRGRPSATTTTTGTPPTAQERDPSRAPRQGRRRPR